MKKICTALLVVIVCSSFCSAVTEEGYAWIADETEAGLWNKGDVPINSGRFPDAVFREYVLKECDGNKDGILSNEEIEKVTTLRIAAKNIANLKGVECFWNLRELDCHSNELVSLDLSENTILESLNCAKNRLEAINISNCPSLGKMVIHRNHLAGVDIENCELLVASLNRKPRVASTHIKWGNKVKIDPETKLTSGNKILYQYGTPETVELSENELVLTIGESVQLKAIVEPEGTATGARWKTSDLGVVMVTREGTVTGIGIGSSVITFKASNGKKATCKVYVKSYRDPIELLGYLGRSMEETTEYPGTILEVNSKGKTIEIEPGCMIYIDQNEKIISVILEDTTNAIYRINGVVIGMNINDAAKLMKRSGWNELYSPLRRGYYLFYKSGLLHEEYSCCITAKGSKTRGPVDNISASITWEQSE